jgi:hypothetical protein
MKSTLVFVYNADSGVFNALTDLAHKTFSPATYACNLCALTYGTFGMRASWKEFLEKVDRSLEFLHADELQQKYGVTGVPLPAVFEREGATVRLLIDDEKINACRTIDDLKQLISEHLN